MNKLPSIMNTYQNALSLYSKTFISVLPFALLLGLAEHFYSDAFQLSLAPEHPPLLPHEWLMFGGYIFVYLVIYCLFFSIVIYGINQVKHQQPFSYEKAFRNGSARAIQLFLSILILLSPIAVFMIGSLLIGSALQGYGFGKSSSLMQLLTTVYYLSFVAVSIATFFFVIYVYVSSTLIVNYGYNAWDGLKQSWKITKNHWFKTFVLIAILGLCLSLVSWALGKVVGNYSDEIVTILSFSFGVSLIVTHFENLNQAYQEKIPTPSVPKQIKE